MEALSYVSLLLVHIGILAMFLFVGISLTKSRIDDMDVLLGVCSLVVAAAQLFNILYSIYLYMGVSWGESLWIQ